METIQLENDIKVFYVQATSFPQGIMAAHEKLHALVPPSAGRKYFGISRPEDGTIQYKAAAEEMQAGEAEKYHCPTLVIKKGTYSHITVRDYMQKTEEIGKAFEQILQLPNIDPQGYCVEWYFNEKDVHCMVRMAKQAKE